MYHQHWLPKSTNSEQPRERYFHAACALSPTLLLVSGGWDGGADLDDCWILDLVTRTWTEVRHWCVVVECHICYMLTLGVCKALEHITRVYLYLHDELMVQCIVLYIGLCYVHVHIAEIGSTFLQ